MADLLPSSPDPSAGDGGNPRVIGVDSDDADALLSALQSETAREVLDVLYDEPATPSALAEEVDTSIQNVRYHLEKLTDADLVEVADTIYSEKGREMKVYAPSAKPLVVFAGNDEDAPGIEAALSRLLGALSVLGLSSLAVQRIFGGRAGVGGSAPVFQGDDAAEVTTESGGAGAGDDSATVVEAESETVAESAETVNVTGSEKSGTVTESADSGTVTEGTESGTVTDGTNSDGGTTVEGTTEGTRTVEESTEATHTVEETTRTVEDATRTVEETTEATRTVTEATRTAEDTVETTRVVEETTEAVDPVETTAESTRTVAETTQAVAETTRTVTEEAATSTTTAVDAAGSATGSLPPGALFFAGGLVVLLVLGVAWFWRTR